MDLRALGSPKWKSRPSIFLPKSFIFVHQSDFSLFQPETVLGTISVPTWVNFDTILDSKSGKTVPETTSKNPSMFHTLFYRFFDNFGLQKRRPLSSRRPAVFVPKSASDPFLAILGPSWPSCMDFGGIFVVLGSLFRDSGLILRCHFGIGAYIFDTNSGP